MRELAESVGLGIRYRDPTGYTIVSCTRSGSSVRLGRVVSTENCENAMIHPVPRVDRHEPLFTVCVSILLVLLLVATAFLAN